MSKQSSPKDPVARAVVSLDAGHRSMQDLIRAVEERFNSSSRLADLLHGVLTGSYVSEEFYRSESARAEVSDDFRELLRVIEQMRSRDLFGGLPELDMDELGRIVSMLHERVTDKIPLEDRWDVDCLFHPEANASFASIAGYCEGCPCPLPERGRGRPRRYCRPSCKQRSHRSRKQKSNDLELRVVQDDSTVRVMSLAEALGAGRRSGR